MLFCPGIPGAGKTMMAAIAVDHLLNTVQTANVGVAYLYCNYKRQAEHTAPNLLAAVLKQLVQDRPSIAQLLSGFYDHHEVRKTRLSLEETVSALESVVGNYSKVYVVIDALDECSERDDTRTRSQLLKVCHSLQGQTDLRLMATSRHISDIEAEFKDMPQVEVRASNADVKRYVVGKIDRLAKCIQRDRDLQELVKDRVVEAVDGMFLLARLHVDSLIDKITKAKVKSALNNLSKGPGALNNAYNEAIVRIDGQPPNHRVLAKNVLSWISYAQRPLTTGELCHALAVEMADKELDPDNIPDIEDILSACAGLVTVDEESQIIRLVHYTTQDYLEGIREKWNPDAQQGIASTCLTYLNFEPFRRGSFPTDAEFESRLEEHKFLDYAAWYWHQHVANVQEEISELAMTLLQDSERVACILQSTSIFPFKYKGYSQSFPTKVTGLHLAVSLGLLHLSKEILSWVERENMIHVDARDSDGRTPLAWAARNGHKDTVELLLGSRTADVDTNDNDGWTPLMLAANYGHKDIVELLLDTGRVDTQAENNDGWTSLELTAQNGHTDTLKLLLNSEKADVGANDDYRQRLLMLAAQDGHKATVEFLLGGGKADPIAMPNDRRTPLMLAAQDGHKDTVDLLLSSRKFDPNVADDNGLTPLVLAARDGHKNTVELLLGSGKVDAIARTENGFTALMLAARYGYKGTVKVLLSVGKADVEAKDNDGWTALMWAAQNGHKDTVKVLLSVGKADVEAKGNDRWTALRMAAENGHKDTVEVLLSTGKADVEAKSDGGWTALMLAAQYGHKDTVEVLLSDGKADVYAKNNGGSTALDLAQRNKHKDTRELLRLYVKRS